MCGKSNTWNLNLETSSESDRTNLEPKPLSLPHYNPGFSYADSEDNGQDTTCRPNPIHHTSVSCHPPGEGISHGEAFVIQESTEPVPCTLPSEEVELTEDTSNPAEINGQATSLSAVDNSVPSCDHEVVVIHQNIRYSVNKYLAPLPRATTFFVLDHVRATFILHCSR